MLLLLAIAASLFGIVMIYAAASYTGSSRYIIVQSGALIAGILIYLAMTAFDIDILAGQRTLLFIFNAVFIGMLLIWGVEGDTGNRSWLEFPFLPFNIQPAEVCKITFVIILAKTMSIHRNRISSPRCIAELSFHAVFIVGLIVVISRDVGVALIFIAIFAAMLFMGGVSGWWLLGGVGAVTVASPYIWEYALRDYQKNRILALINPEKYDPTGEQYLWQTNLNLQALRNGGLSGQGLFHGSLTSDGDIPAQHTDSIFATIGEQLGMIGCIAVLLLLFLIVLRILYVAMKSPDYMNRLICIGIAAMFLFQILINVGVSLGILPVVGLALPFFSYGGSSILTTFLALGVVSGIKMRPARDISAHYIRPY